MKKVSLFGGLAIAAISFASIVASARPETTVYVGSQMPTPLANGDKSCGGGTAIAFQSFGGINVKVEGARWCDVIEVKAMTGRTLDALTVGLNAFDKSGTVILGQNDPSQVKVVVRSLGTDNGQTILVRVAPPAPPTPPQFVTFLGDASPKYLPGYACGEGANVKAMIGLQGFPVLIVNGAKECNLLIATNSAGRELYTANLNFNGAGHIDLSDRPEAVKFVNRNTGEKFKVRIQY